MWATKQEIGLDITDQNQNPARRAWADHVVSCEVCGPVANDGTLDGAFTKFCPDGRALAEAEMAAYMAAVSDRMGQGRRSRERHD